LYINIINWSSNIITSVPNNKFDIYNYKIKKLPISFTIFSFFISYDTVSCSVKVSNWLFHVTKRTSCIVKIIHFFYSIQFFKLSLKYCVCVYWQNHLGCSYYYVVFRIFRLTFVWNSTNITCLFLFSMSNSRFSESCRRIL